MRASTDVSFKTRFTEDSEITPKSAERSHWFCISKKNMQTEIIYAVERVKYLMNLTICWKWLPSGLRFFYRFVPGLLNFGQGLLGAVVALRPHPVNLPLAGVIHSGYFGSPEHCSRIYQWPAITIRAVWPVSVGHGVPESPFIKRQSWWFLSLNYNLPVTLITSSLLKVAYNGIFFQGKSKSKDLWWRV